MADSQRSAHDILDTQALGKNWEEIMLLFHDDKSQVEEVRDFIRSGQVPASAQPWGVNHVYNFQRGSVSAIEQPRQFATFLCALPGANERGRAQEIYIRQGGLLRSHSTMYGPGHFLHLLEGSADTKDPITVRDLEELAPVLGCFTADQLLTDTLSTKRYTRTTYLRSVGGLDEYFATNRDAIRAALRPANAGQKVIWPRLFHAPDFVREHLAEELCDAASANAKALHTTVASAYDTLPTESKIEGLSLVLDRARPAQRARIVELADALELDDARTAFLEKLKADLGNDRSEAVREALAALGGANKRQDVPAVPAVTIPEVPLRSFPGYTDLSRRGQNPYAPVNGLPGSWGTLGAVAKLLKSEHKVLKKFQPHHIVRLLSATHARQIAYIGSGDRSPFSQLRNSPLRPSPLDVSATLLHDGKSAQDAVALVALFLGAEPDFWASEQVSVWANYHPAEIVGILDQRIEYGHREGFFTLLGLITPRPDWLEAALVAAAVNGYKSEKATIRKMLDASCLKLALPYLGSKKRPERIGAADLLSAVKAEGAIEAIRKQARKEKDDGALVALIGALDTLGAPVDEFTSAEALTTRAASAMAKKNAIPKSIDWLGLDALPQVRWANGTLVDQSVMQWFITSGVKSKASIPSPLMLKHFEAMEPSDLERFGLALLELWIHQDTRTMPEDEVQERAALSAQRQFSYRQSNPAYAQQETLASITARMATHFRGQQLGSATPSKGLLSLVAGSAGAAAVDPAMRYIRKYRGNKMSQAKSLLQMLAWIDEPESIQEVMAVASNFRPKGIQKAAVTEAELLADRKGWTLDDLADRSVPDASFEADGRFVIDYGTRTFTAHLADDLTVTLKNDETGKTVRSLPKGRQDEDAELIAEQKKLFSASKKQLKAVLKAQPGRLHVAMCVQRSWEPDDFRRYFVDHPVTARLASRLVWMSTVEGSAPVGFRPLTDGTLVDVNDEDFELPDNAEITIAHGHLLADSESSWIEHLADYEVDPLFPQLDRPTISVESGARVIDAYSGYAIGDRTLRGQMTKLAWQLGAPQDAGWVGEIIKDLATIDRKAVITLHGGINAGGYDAGDGELAIAELFFLPSAGGGWHDRQAALPLSEIPPILLSETYAELQQIAAAGDGFNPKFVKGAA